MLFRPRKGTKGTKKIFCAFCAFLWLFFFGPVCGAVIHRRSQQRSFRYFWEQADPQTGLVPDRARMDGSPLAAQSSKCRQHCGHRFWSDVTLHRRRSKLDRASRRHSNARATRCASSTRALFSNAAGSITGWMRRPASDAGTAKSLRSIRRCCSQAFSPCGNVFATIAEIVRLATGSTSASTFAGCSTAIRCFLSHGWKPETGFLRARWDTYSEDTILYLLAIGSPTHPISPASWYALWRDRYRYEGHSYFTTIGVPLFMHQYSHAWIDYRNRRETKGDRIDYFQNSVAATLAHRAFCMNLSHDFPAFGPDVWGITASDSAKGYLAWGGPPRDPDIDGTLVPSAAGGSLMFTPELATRALANDARKVRRRRSTASMASSTPSTPKPAGSTPTSSASTSASFS